MIKTGSVLEKLCRAVDRERGRVERAKARVEDLREQYKTAHWTKRREIADKGFKAKQVLEVIEGDLKAAELALEAEEKRLLQPDSFLRFG